MWAILNGTIVNALTVLAGSSIGTVVGRRFSERARGILLAGLGLITVWIGVDSSVNGYRAVSARLPPAMAARVAMVAVLSLLGGSLLGTALRLQEGVEGLGRWLHRRFGPPAATGRPGASSERSIAEGFLASSLVFCVGPLTLLGCLANGAPPHDPGFLYIKSLLDAFSSTALAASLGVGVVFSVLTILVFQGGLALAAYGAGSFLSTDAIHLMSCVGGMILIANALMLLEIKRVAVADMLPGLFLPPVLLAAGRAVPGLLPI